MSASLALASCSSLPRSGPSTDEILDGFLKGDNQLGVKLVDLTPEVTKELANAPRPTLDKIDRLKSARPVGLIGPGDTLLVSIYEAGPGLFSNLQRQNTNGDTGSTAETLPRLQVNRSGLIEVPYVGMVHVAGLTPTEVERLLEARLAEKASQPQVIVNVVAGETNSIIVSGDVKNPGRRQLTMAGESLLDVIALSGGANRPSPDMTVSVTRGTSKATVPLVEIESTPSENILIQPSDRVQVDFAPRTFLVFGATGRVAQTPFDAPNVSLAEAIARSGGLDDNRANPASIFLFRMEPAFRVRALGIESNADSVPIVYHADMRDPKSFFIMQRLALEDKDLLYVANSGSTQLYKFLQLIYTIVTPVVTGKQLSN